MARGSIPPVTEALKTFKKATNISTLRVMARQLNASYGLILRMGHVKLHDASSGQIQEALLERDIAINVLTRIFDDVVLWHKNNHKAQNFDLDVSDLMMISTRNINLSRDLEQVVEMMSLIELAKTYWELDVKIIYLGKPLHTFGYTPSGKADLLTGLRALCGPREITIKHVSDKVDKIATEGTYAIEDYDRWPVEE